MKVARWIPCILSGALACSASLAQSGPTEEIQSLARQWTDLERQRNTIESDWRETQPVLEQQLALLERERAELSDFLDQTEAAQDEVEERRLELLERQSVLEQEESLLLEALDAAVIQVRDLYRQLPPPVVAAWDDRMPELRAEFLTTSEKLQVLLEMLGVLDDFHRRLSLHEEILTLADGEEYLVREVYLGISQGWYVSANSAHAGSGAPSVNGWQWRNIDDPVAVGRIIDILERRRNAELVTLPAELGNAAP